MIAVTKQARLEIWTVILVGISKLVTVEFGGQKGAKPLLAAISLLTVATVGLTIFILLPICWIRSDCC